jgi:hypothetical protein
VAGGVRAGLAAASQRLEEPVAGSLGFVPPQPGRQPSRQAGGPPPGHDAGNPTRTPAARRTTRSPGGGTPPRGRPPRTHRPQAGTAIRWPRRHRPRIPSRDRRKARRGGIPHVQRGQHDPPPPPASSKRHRQRARPDTGQDAQIVRPSTAGSNAAP